MIRIKVTGMTCEHCVKAVAGALAAVGGVEGAPKVSLEDGEAVVTGTAAPDALLAAIREEGYEAEVAS